MNLGELTGVKLLGVLLLVAVVGTGGLYYTVYKSQRDQNDAARVKLQAKLRENAELEAYRPKLADIERQLASLKQQLEIERRIVPDEKEVDNFMRMVSGEARKAGVEIRRYTARPTARKSSTPKCRSKWNSTARTTRCWGSSTGWEKWSAS